MVALAEKRNLSDQEKVQRRFTKRLCGLRYVAYTEQLNHLGLLTLELGSLQIDLIFCYKMVFGLSPTSSDYYQFSSNSIRITLINYTYHKTQHLEKKFV